MNQSKRYKLPVAKKMSQIYEIDDIIIWGSSPTAVGSKPWNLMGHQVWHQVRGQTSSYIKTLVDIQIRMQIIGHMQNNENLFNRRT